MPGVCLRYPRPVVTLEIETVGAAPLDPRASEHMVPMRDGVRLATDVYLPDGAGPFPAVLVRLPYDKNGRYCWMPFLATHFIARGYAFVPQDVRGKFRSEGDPLAFVNEVPDGYDTIEWITQQPWSNGDVGMWGDSYYGFTQWAAVAAGHPALKAIVPRVTFADIDGWLDGVTPLYGGHYLGQYWSDHDTHHWTPDWSHRPLAEVFDQAFEQIGSRSASFDYVLERSRGAERIPLFPGAHPFDVLRIPTLHGVGWFDNITPPHMLDYEALVAESRDGAVPVPARRLDRSRELPLRAGADPGVGRPRAARRRARADARALHRARARLLRRLPEPARPIRPACRACAGTSPTSAGRSRPAGRRPVRPSCASTSPIRPAPRVDADGGSLVAAPGERASMSPGCTIPRTSCPRRSSIRSAPSSSIRTSAPSSRAPTC